MATVTESQLRHKIATNWRVQGPNALPRGWDLWCQSLMHNIAEFAQHIPEWDAHPSAMDAYRASRIESTDPGRAPAGVAHFWADPSPDGHVAYDLDGGGTRLLMATRYATDPWALNAGTVSFSDYQRRTGSTYLGWSYTDGRFKLPTLASAVSVAAVPVPEEDDMQTIIKSPSRPHALITAGVFRQLANSEELRVVQKIETKILDKLNDREYDVLRAVYARQRAVTGSEVEAIVKRLPGVGSVDVEAIAAAVNDELAARMAR